MTESVEGFGTCANCGEQLRLDVEYPVATTEANGEFELHSFCDVRCRDAWEASD